MSVRPGLPLLALWTVGACGATYAESPMAGPTSTVEGGGFGGQPQDATARGTPMAGEALPIDQRKVVRTGNLSVSIEEWEPFHRDVESWLAVHGGFVSDLSVNRWEGRVGYARLTVRVPAERMDPLVVWTQEKVEVTQLALHGEDVTAQWIDVDARLGALRQTETRVLALVAEGTATLADVLAAERELGRIRGDIESFEATQRALTDRVELATLTMEVSVRAPYSSLVDVGFGTEAAETWRGSIRAMGVVSRGLALGAVAVTPWLAVLAGGLLGFVGVVRWFVKRR